MSFDMPSVTLRHVVSCHVNLQTPRLRYAMHQQGCHVLGWCRHNRSEQGLKEELQLLIKQQQWEPGFMPNASQLQAAGQHRLIAAVRQRGGFKTIAASIGLSPQRLDKRGRKPKSDAAQEPITQAEQAQVLAQQAADVQQPSGNRAPKCETKAHEQLRILEQVKELELV